MNDAVLRIGSGSHYPLVTGIALLTATTTDVRHTAGLSCDHGIAAFTSKRYNGDQFFLQRAMAKYLALGLLFRNWTIDAHTESYPNFY